MARAVAAFDQRGCVSPHVVYVEDEAPLAELGRRRLEREARLAHEAREPDRGEDEAGGRGKKKKRGGLLQELFDF